MAEVYLAERISHEGPAEQLFAVKRLLPALAKNPMFADMFAYEASLSTTLLHDNIVRCVEFFREDDDYYMVLEYVLGKEVGTVAKVATGWLPIERVKLAVAVGLGVARALCYVHEKTDARGASLGIVHGDISPQNIMISSDGAIKLYDFGAAKTQSASMVFEEKLVRGNWRYMSPEQKAGETIDARSDVYSLSLMMLEMIFGDVRAIREDKNLGAWLHAALPSLGLPDVCCAALIEIFGRSLSHDARERPSAQLLLENLETLAAELKIFDARQLLEQILRTDVPMSSSRARRRRTGGLGYIVYFSAAAASLGLSIWVMIAVFSDLFEPANYHNLPVWPKALPPVEQAEIKIAAREVPVAVPKRKEKVMGKLGTLHVKVRPWAEVFIDGQFFGSTPMGGLNLPEGQYLVQLRNPDVSAVALRMVKIYADKKTELIHNF